jgi:hypothetical protein
MAYERDRLPRRAIVAANPGAAIPALGGSVHFVRHAQDGLRRPLIGRIAIRGQAEPGLVALGCFS